MNCANCYKDKHCKTNNNKHVPGCPTLDKNFVQESNNAYDNNDSRNFMLDSLRQVASGYDISTGDKVPCKTRLQEIIEFAHRMNYKKLGIAFCTALEPEAKALDRILREEKFDVVSAICKVGGIRKEDVGLEDSGKIIPGTTEISCNPLGQAMILNNQKTDFNIVIGLCLGHDSLFLANSDAPCTVFIVKDRVLKHNPRLALNL